MKSSWGRCWRPSDAPFPREAARRHPADAVTRGQRLGERRAQDHKTFPIEGFCGPGARVGKGEVAVDVVLDKRDFPRRKHLHQGLLPVVGHAAPGRVAVVCADEAGLHGRVLHRVSQGFQADPLLRARWDLHDFQPHGGHGLQVIEEEWRFDRDRVSGATEGPKGDCDCLVAARGDDDFIGGQREAGLDRPLGDLFSQRSVAV